MGRDVQRWVWTAAAWLLALPLAAETVPGARPETVAALARGEWPAYGGSNAQQRWSPLDQIGPENARRLRVAWRWRSPDEELRARGLAVSQSYRNAASPLMIGGTLYVSTSLTQVAAIDALSGVTKWVFDPRVYKYGPHPGNNGWTHRGVGYWRDGEDERIIVLTKYALMIALDAKTGRPIAGFGEGGTVDLTRGLRAPAPRGYYDMESPPTIVGDTIVVGSSIWDWWANRSALPGDVRGFDVRSGKLRWTFHTVPRAGEPGVETWLDESWRAAGNANVWAQISADESLGLIYLPVSTPTNDYYGGHRPGDNLYGESLVCLEAATGRLVWHYQIVRHGLWDYDLPAAPILADLVVEGRPVKAVVQLTKQGLVFVFDRVTGRPLWPIEDRAVPPSDVPGEHAAPTQPFPTRPAPVEIQGVRVEDLIDFTPALRRQALEIVGRYRHGPLYTPPSREGTILMPGITGAINWDGGTVDPETGMLYVATQRSPYVVTLRRPGPDEGYFAWIGGFQHLSGPQGLPLFKPPYASLLAIDLNSGEHRWRTPLGRGPLRHPALGGVALPERLGAPNVRGWTLVTRRLLFAVKSGAMFNTRSGPHGRRIYDQDRSDAHLWVYDKASGAMLAEIPIGSNAGGAPIAYLAGGKQLVVFPVGGGNVAEELVALALP